MRRNFTKDELIQAAWPELKDDVQDFSKILKWVSENVAPATLQRMAGGWLTRLLTEYQRELTRLAEEEASRVRQRKLEEYENSREGKAARKKREEEFERREEERIRANDEFQRNFQRKIKDMLDQYKIDIIQEWTEDLLKQKIALPDGTQITWGSATLDQHKARYVMFQKHVEANVTGMARHQQAIEALETSGADTLNELVLGTKVA